ncbi:MAG: 3-phosphoshikimate 1-carboxyvinyltransferase [Verrucomicrobiota bacterium]|jgi:3-phosphoshikimate 1-carboxyvinyltransferase
MPLPGTIEIVPLDKPVRAQITVPGSKSITNRALILAALADGEVTLTGALWSEDTQVMTEALQKLGFQIKVEPDAEEFCNRTITVQGLGGKIPNTGTAEKPLDLFVGNAGTAARFLAAFVCLGNGVYRLHGVPRMHERPQAALFKALRELGYRVESEKGNDKLPAIICGRDAASATQYSAAKIRDGGTPSLAKKCRVSIEESSQFASALLLCAKVGSWKVEVVGENAEESPYVLMTSQLLKKFAHRGGGFRIEPDASSASYFSAVGLLDFWTMHSYPIMPESWRVEVIVRNWPVNSWQIDGHFPVWFNQLPSARISRKTDLGDSIMTAITLSPFLSSQSTFTDLARLRVQETERVVALRTELTKCGAKVEEKGDTLTVYPSKLHGAEIETYNDHRMAMCFAILGLKVPGIKIKNPACVKKTFPNFFQKLATPPPKGLGATILDAKTGRKLPVAELFAE